MADRDVTLAEGNPDESKIGAFVRQVFILPFQFSDSRLSATSDRALVRAPHKALKFMT